MRIRLPFAGLFLLLCLLAGYAGLSSLQLGAYVNDKVLHLLTFFLLTVVFYWVVDTSRRRTVNLTAAVCTLLGGVGSEFVQSVIPGNGREFDVTDIAANMVGSLAALGLCSWYHKRMLERRRLSRHRYTAVPGADGAELELGEGVGHQEEGLMGGVEGTTTLEEEVDNWDENAVDPWDEDDAGDRTADGIGNSSGSGTAGKGKDEIELNSPTATDSKTRVD
ncbi:hypothetical protein DL771_002320 [Monosporascus sp. 5C6A]|nr:hypothetical protein DL771_002320 [Monosporascus sp. 5C6A]